MELFAIADRDKNPAARRKFAAGYAEPTNKDERAQKRACKLTVNPGKLTLPE